MLWVTLANVHLDRVAAPWLVKRFVDRDAEFAFVVWGLDGKLPDPSVNASAPPDAIPLGLPGVELGLHDSEGSCFAKVLRAYHLEDPALWRMEGILAAGINRALSLPLRANETEEERVLGTALDQLGDALGLLFDDAEHIEKALPLYDAVYEHCRLLELPSQVLAEAPPVPPLRTPYLRAALADLDKPAVD